MTSRGARRPQKQHVAHSCRRSKLGVVQLIPRSLQPLSVVRSATIRWHSMPRNWLIHELVHGRCAGRRGRGTGNSGLVNASVRARARMAPMAGWGKIRLVQSALALTTPAARRFGMAP
jgi:hypothetical protein